MSLFEAITNESVADVETLLSNGVDPNIVIATPRGDLSALSHAVIHFSTDENSDVYTGCHILRVLVGHGAQIDFPVNGSTPLMHSVMHSDRISHPVIVFTLISLGANPFLAIDEVSALSIALDGPRYNLWVTWLFRRYDVEMVVSHLFAMRTDRIFPMIMTTSLLWNYHVLIHVSHEAREKLDKWLLHLYSVSPELHYDSQEFFFTSVAMCADARASLLSIARAIDRVHPSVPV